VKLGMVISRTILITVIHANNEAGTIEPIPEISAIAREAIYTGRYLFPCSPTTGGEPMGPWMFRGGGMWVFPVISEGGQ